MTIQDEIDAALIARFQAPLADPRAGDINITWERVEPYEIDDNSRKKKYAIGLVEKGEKYSSKSSLQEVTVQYAIEFFVRSNKNEDIRQVLTAAKADIFRRMMADQNLGDLLDDTIPLASETFVSRADSFGEGVLIFDLKYRTKPDDIRTSY